ncbi:MAG: hypothetical protein A2202_08840 [Bdellovibrionales bacterium RIFOXYA1_FULL_36_14]|nr:MAG: hypothetical protein A2202_08840 [Bdellovibrionales bacterium RIFOXYA1_FULL_36_14]
MHHLFRTHLFFLFLLLFISTFDLLAISAGKEYSGWALLNHKASINLPHLGYTHFKKDVTVAIIDSGIDITHPYLRPNLILNNENKSLDDTLGHGTHVAGIIKSVFPKVKILPIKYYDENATGKENLEKTIEAIQYAIKMKVDIINYSAGGDGASLRERQALEQAQEQGILVVVAAGNNGRNIDLAFNHYYPANYNLSNILTVVNHNENIELSTLSNFGEKSAHISAPGNRIKSTYPNNRSGYLSGTSQATAFVTGVAALIKAYQPSLTYQDIKNIILQSSKKEKSLQGKCLTGARLDARSALNLAQSYIRKVSFVP